MHSNFDMNDSHLDYSNLLYTNPLLFELQLEYPIAQFSESFSGLVSETHFTIWTTLKLRGYRIYTTEHPISRAHGGTAIIIKESIKHYEFDKHP